MCRWNLFGMMQHPRIRNLQYYARMDTDSRFTKPVRAGPACFQDYNLGYAVVKMLPI